MPVRSLPAVQWINAPRGGFEEVARGGIGAEGELERNNELRWGEGGGREAR